MFWKYNNTSSSPIESVLCKEDVTLQELMDEEDIINECKLQNKALIDFLSKPEVMDELVTLTTVEPSINLDERMRFKYPNIACELLTCDVPALNERLAGDEALLEKLYTFLNCEPPLNPLLASFFSKILGVLIAKKTEQNWLSYQFTCLQVLDFLKAKDNFIQLLLKHLGTSAIMDLTLKLMTQVEGVEMRQNILNWLDSQRIMQSLVSLLDPTVDKERHYNVAQLLCDFIKCARDTQRHSTERADPDPLLNTIESPETVKLLLDHILGEDKCETAIVGGIQVLLVLLDVNKNSIPKYDSQNIYNSSSYDDVNDIEQRQKVIQNTTKEIQKRLKDFHDLLLNPPKKAPISTTIGILEQPLGNTRLQVTKLFAAVVSTNNQELMQELINLNTLQVLLDLFFKYPWNNFLHTQVELCITSALKITVPQEQGDYNALCKNLLINCDLISRILGAWRENDAQQCQTKGVRQGYMGHLINIVNKLVHLCSTTPLGNFVKENLPESAEELEKFKETTLQEINKMQETLLGGAHPNTSNEDSDDYSDISFPHSGPLQQQMYSQYQMQQITPQFIETYGFHDDDFNGGDDTLQTIDHRTGLNFDISDNDMSQNNEIFKQLCAQNINTLDDAEDQIFEDREHDHTYQTVVERQWGEKNDPAYNSSDSDDDSPPPGDEVSPIDPWSNKDNCINDENPWGKVETLGDDSGWADFKSACFTGFDSAFPSPPQEQQQQHEQQQQQQHLSESEKKEEKPVTDLKVENIVIVNEEEEEEEKEKGKQKDDTKKEEVDANITPVAQDVPSEGATIENKSIGDGKDVEANQQHNLQPSINTSEVSTAGDGTILPLTDEVINTLNKPEPDNLNV